MPEEQKVQYGKKWAGSKRVCLQIDDIAPKLLSRSLETNLKSPDPINCPREETLSASICVFSEV